MASARVDVPAWQWIPPHRVALHGSAIAAYMRLWRARCRQWDRILMCSVFFVRCPLCRRPARWRRLPGSSSATFACLYGPKLQRYLTSMHACTCLKNACSSRHPSSITRLSHRRARSLHDPPCPVRGTGVPSLTSPDNFHLALPRNADISRDFGRSYQHAHRVDHTI